jgi:hypothetical protein
MAVTVYISMKILISWYPDLFCSYVVTSFLVLSEWIKEFLMLKELLPIVFASHNKLNLLLIILQG